MVWLPLLPLVGLLCVCSFTCFGFYVLQCWVSFVGVLHVGLRRFRFVLFLVLGLLSWCTALCASVSSVLSCVWCWVSLVGVLHFCASVSSVLFCVWCLVSLVGVLHFVLLLCSCPCSFCTVLQFLGQVGRVRFPGEVGELAPYGGAPYLRWTHSVGLALYPRYG